MLDTICTLALPIDLFAQVLHPTEPLLTVGLSSGHVLTYRLPPVDDQDLQNGSVDDSDDDYNVKAHPDGTPAPIISNLRRSSSASENGLGSIATLWRTKRHKVSCRCLAHSHDGLLCYSAGADGLVKAFETETGRVISKIATPQAGLRVNGTRAADEIDAPTVLHALSSQSLILGTDSGKVYLHDLRQGGREVIGKPSQTWSPHGGEHVNKITPLPVSEASTSGFPKQWISIGGTTLSVTDLRKGVISTSEDQGAELTSCAVVTGLKKGGTSVGEKVLVGQEDGIMTLWERGVWGDLDERIVVARSGIGVESLAELPSGMGLGALRMNEKIVAAGMEDGGVRFVRVGRNGVLNEWDVKHDEVDGVVGLGFDVGGRMVSGGGNVVKVWTEAKGMPGGGKKSSTFDRASNPSDDEEDDQDVGDSSDDDDDDKEEREKPKRKKRKRNKGKDKSGGQVLRFSGSL